MLTSNPYLHTKKKKKKKLKTEKKPKNKKKKKNRQVGDTRKLDKRRLWKTATGNRYSVYYQTSTVPVAIHNSLQSISIHHPRKEPVAIFKLL